MGIEFAWLFPCLASLEQNLPTSCHSEFEPTLWWIHFEHFDPASASWWKKQMPTTLIVYPTFLTKPSYSSCFLKIPDVRLKSEAGQKESVTLSYQSMYPGSSSLSQIRTNSQWICMDVIGNIESPNHRFPEPEKRTLNQWHDVKLNWGVLYHL